MPLDLLAAVAHPDDAELLAGGTLAKAVDAGRRVGILDLTHGEMGSRGNAEIRAREAAAASLVLGITARTNAGLPDGHLENNDAMRRVVVEQLRRILGIIVGLTVGELLKLVLKLDSGAPLWSAVVAVCASVAIGLVFGMIPATRAARMDPVEALRHE